MPPVLLATCAALPNGDEDAALLVRALDHRGIEARWAVWDDPDVDWAAAPVVLRSTWDYTLRREDFLTWLGDVPQVLNPVDVVSWSSDKTYLLDLAVSGIAITPTTVAPPGTPLVAPDAAEFVVKPSVGAGSRGAGRFTTGSVGAAQAHVDALHAAGRTVLVQPYLAEVDEHGETALLYFDGVFSHAVRKGAMLAGGTAHPIDESSGLFIEENIEARRATDDELRLGAAVLDDLAGRFGAAPLYARVDLLPSMRGPVVVEVELVEPSLFLSFDGAAADRIAAAIEKRTTR